MAFGEEGFFDVWIEAVANDADQVAKAGDEADTIGQDKSVFANKLFCLNTLWRQISQFQQGKNRTRRRIAGGCRHHNFAMVQALLEERKGKASLTLDFRYRNFFEMVICNRFESFVIVLVPRWPNVIVLKGSQSKNHGNAGM